jgi:hypothetical protein
LIFGVLENGLCSAFAGLDYCQVSISSVILHEESCGPFRQTSACNVLQEQLACSRKDVPPLLALVPYRSCLFWLVRATMRRDPGYVACTFSKILLDMCSPDIQPQHLLRDLSNIRQLHNCAVCEKTSHVPCRLNLACIFRVWVPKLCKSRCQVTFAKRCPDTSRSPYRSHARKSRIGVFASITSIAYHKKMYLKHTMNPLLC